MSFPRYPQYKNNGVKWFPEIPAHWRTVPIKRLFASIESGTSVNASDEPADPSSIGVLKTSCVYSGRFDPAANKKVLENELAQVSCPLRVGSLIVSRMNTPELVGAAGFVEVAPPNLYLPDRLWQISFRNANARFIYYWTLTSIYRGQVEAACTGTSSSMKNLGQDQFGSFAFAAPPLIEQAQITAFLDRETAKIDALVADQQRLMELLKEKRQAIISHAVTKGLNPLARMTDSGIEWLGKVPAHWKIAPVKHLVKMTSGGTPNKGNLDYWDGDIPWASSKDLKGEQLSDTEDHITAQAVDDGVAELVPTGSILIVVRGMILIHTFPVVKALVPMAINQDLKALTPCSALSGDYLSWLLRGSAREILGRVDEAAHGTTVLRMEAWTSMPLPVPPLEEQKLIVATLIKRLRQLDGLAREAHRAVDVLLERRTALITAAVTGQIDVRNLKERRSAA